MTNTEKTSYLHYVTRVSGLDREVVDALHMHDVAAVDTDGDVHTWSFPGTVPEAILALSNARLKLDKKADAAAVAAIDHVWTILSFYRSKGEHGQVEVGRIAEDNRALARHDTRLADLEEVRVQLERLENQKIGLIHMARVDGCSWTEIGKALGVTKQSAQAWYASRVG